jgi:hypothetical protein
MAWYNFWKKENVNEEIDAFKGKGAEETPDEAQGEGLGALSSIPNYGAVQLTSFNTFYKNYINKSFSTEKSKIMNYRNMSSTPEIADVIEDAVNESTQEDDDGNIIHLKLENELNKNATNNVYREFNKLFYNNINIQEKIWDLLRTYFIDGRVYYERIINEKKKQDGIINIKRLPSETMDFAYDTNTGKVKFFFQYLSGKPKRPTSIEEAKKDDNIVVFNPQQIGYVNYGIYGRNLTEIMGYLEKAKVPYNQLKLLETSVIIYRIVRSPERFVFRIDTGNMPKEKAMKFVEKIKQKFTKKQSYDPTTGRLTHDPEIMSLLENFFLPQCLRTTTTPIALLDGRTIMLDQLIDEHNKGIKHEVYSVNQKTGKIIRGKVKWAGITRKNAKLVRVHLDNGKYVDCTPDHKFVMRNGKEIEAQNLNEGDSLMPLYKRDKKNKLGKQSFYIIMNKVLDSNDYTNLKQKLVVNHKVVKVEKLDIKEDTGCLTIEDPGSNHNFALGVGVFVKNSADGRGSSIDTVGGDAKGFTELDDIYYFARKLYRALKYPISRVIAAEEKQQGDIVFGGTNTGEIQRDEIKWAKFLERQQSRLCSDFVDLFLLHLDFKGMKKQYGLNKDNIRIHMNAPSHYKEQMQQNFLESRFNNYTTLSTNPEFSKSYLMGKYLGWSEEEIKENAEGKKKDKEFGFEEEGGF